MRPDSHMYRRALATRKSTSRNRFTSMAGVLVAFALFVLAACGDSGTGPDTEVATVSVSPATRALVVGDATTLAASVKNRAGDPLGGREIQWSSSNPAVADVSSTGRVEALQAGAATITATSEGKSGTARITVTDAGPPPPAVVARVEIDPAALVIPKYESRPLAARALDAQGNELEDRAIVWTVVNDVVATVDESGRLTARETGWTRVYATVEGKSAVLDLTVSPAPVARVVLAWAGPELDRGEAVQLHVRLEDAFGVELDDRQIDWSSSDAGVVRVEQGGMVFALTEGRATITATSEGRSASVELRIVPPPAFDLIFDSPTSAGGAEIFVLELGYQTLPRRLNAGNVSRDPSASPDGESFVFAVSQRDLATGAPQNDLFIVNVNGMGMKRLTSAPGIEQEPAWSPDGKRIAFSATDEEGRTDIWVVNVNGSGLVNLTAGMGPFSDERAPAWNRDGSRIAFATTSGGISSAIWTMRADGSDRVRIASDVTHGMQPTWSPDGTRIAFQYFSGAATGTDIAIVPASGGATTKLALAGDQVAPAWSPDGALIAFTGFAANGGPRIWTMRPDGTGARARATGPGRNPAWIVR